MLSLAFLTVCFPYIDVHYSSHPVVTIFSQNITKTFPLAFLQHSTQAPTLFLAYFTIHPYFSFLSTILQTSISPSHSCPFLPNLLLCMLLSSRNSFHAHLTPAIMTLPSPFNVSLKQHSLHFIHCVRSLLGHPSGIVHMTFTQSFQSHHKLYHFP